jgi:hypothetical protein
VLDLVTHASGERGTLAWGSAWLVLGLGALPGLWAIIRLRRLEPVDLMAKPNAGAARD